MSFMDELPTLLREPTWEQPTGCHCGADLSPGWDYCPSCGDPIDGWEDMYLCSLHRKAELAQYTKPGERGFSCVCLVCGATWLKPEDSVGKTPDSFGTELSKYHKLYFERFFGRKL